MEENKSGQKVEPSKKVGAVGEFLGIILFLALLAALGYGLLTFIQMISEAWAVTMSGMTTGFDNNFYPHQ